MVLMLLRRARSKGTLTLSADNYRAKNLMNLSNEPCHAMLFLFLTAACATLKKQINFSADVLSDCSFMKNTHPNLWPFLKRTVATKAMKPGLLAHAVGLGRASADEGSLMFVNTAFQ